MNSQSRPSSAPRSAGSTLIPVSNNLINRDSQSGERQPSGKRKREASGPSGVQSTAKEKVSAPSSEDLLEPTIVLKPHPSDLRVKPRILQPLMLLPREHLHLSALDLSRPAGDFPASRFYESRIKILDLEHRLGSNILLARSGLNESVYAIEREGDGLYVLCKVGAWVDVASLGRLATVVSSRRLKPKPAMGGTINAEAPVTTLHMHHENKRRRLAIDEIHSVISNKRARSVSVVRSEQQIPTPAQTDSPPPETLTHEGVRTSKPNENQPRGSEDVPISNLTPADEEPTTQPSVEDIFQNIRTQYFEALYHSMGSLAYFAKGPLSRARAAFRLDDDSNLDLKDLLEFLKSLVMTTVVIDKKYRDTMPEIIASFKTSIEASEGDEEKPKKKKPKKVRLGKDGLYTGEPAHIKRWWASRQPAVSEDEEKVMSRQEVALHISYLRRRETLLQMILILEILALEPLNRTADNTETLLPGTDAQDTSKDKEAVPLPKKRNKHNFPVLLDLQADRLCIWNSTTLDEVKALAESQRAQEPEAQKSASTVSDSLPDFCRDVILPFFSARLPEICDSINRKLGGPVKTTAPVAKPVKPAVKARPGAPTKRRPVSGKDKDRALEHALSKDKERLRRSISRGQDALALMRSASTVAIPGLKREASDLLMAVIPKAERAVSKERQSALFSRSHSFTNDADLRAKKKAEVDAELREAISALKKPNRALAGKEIIEEAEKRKTPQLKKLKKGGRVVATQGVVKATPANNRFRDAIGPDAKDSEMALVPEEDHVPSSSSVMPSSTVPRKLADMLGLGGSLSRSAPGHIKATPARNLSASLHEVQASLDGFAIPSSSPIMARKAAPTTNSQPNFFAPTKSDRGTEIQDCLPSSPGLPALFQTPSKPRSAMGSMVRMAAETPLKSKAPALAGNGSEHQGNPMGLEAPPPKATTIFEHLGWDEEDLENLA